MITDQISIATIEEAVPALVPRGFRRLKSSEVVTPGDYLVDDLRGFEPWQGPGGFRADSFLKPIYRQKKTARWAAAGQTK